MPSLDTNLLLRWLLDDIPKQAEAVRRLLASGQEFVLADAALLEVAYVLSTSNGLSRSLVADYLEAVLAVRAIIIDRTVWQRVIAHYRAHPKLSIVDCYLEARASVSGDTPLLTFDTKLASQLPNAELLR